MNKEDEGKVMLCIFTLGGVVGFLIGLYVSTCRVEGEAIEKGLMHHNPITGGKEWVK